MTRENVRSLTGSRWRVREADETAVQELSRATGVHGMTARALVCRGIGSAAEARGFLAHDLANLADAFAMADMENAVGRVEGALERGVRIRVHGDYDVDGVCATALLVRALRGLGGEVDWHIPHRLDEGYGVSEEAVRQAAEDGIGLLLTADCGSTALGPIALARELGLDVVVTDHHRPGDELPDAVVLNPWRADCPYPFKDLAGVGVSFKLVSALARRRALPEGQELRFLDLVCLGTVADVVPLLGENRLLVHHGLRRLPETRKVGIAALMEAAGVRGEIGSQQVAFGLAPRINAAGRMEHARAALRLLLTADEGTARTLAAGLSEQNDRRREQERETLAEAEQMVGTEVDLARDKAIVLASEGWHPGVIGIVASRLVERYHRPALLIAVRDDVGKGSGRSVEAFNLWDALRRCAHLLTRYGGHHYAAGFGLASTRIDAFRQCINEVAEECLRTEDLVRHIDIDAQVTLCDLDVETVMDLNRLAPFGRGNPTPVVLTRRARVGEVRRVGAGESHLSLRLAGDDGAERGAIWFGAGELADQLPVGASVDVCCKPRVDAWAGDATVRLHVQDIGVQDGA